MVTLAENPLRVGLRQERTPEPLILVIFGASGDLNQRKLVPAHLPSQTTTTVTSGTHHCRGCPTRLES